MFRNYQELFLGYVEFYKSNLFTDVTASSAALVARNADYFLGGSNDPLGLASLRLTNLIENNGTSTTTSTNLASGKINSDYAQSANTLASTIKAKMGPYKQAIEKNLFNLNEYLIGNIRFKLDEAPSQHSPAIGSTLIEEDGQQITIGSFNRLAPMDFIHVFSLVFIFVLAKRALSYSLKQSLFIKQLGLRPKDRERLDECIWRLLFYTFSSTWLVYSCFLKHNSMFLFSGHTANFAEYSFTVDLDEYVICLIESAFYLHATYALVFEDVWRRDSPMMLVHHFAAIFSVSSVYATRTHRIGLAIVVLRDTCDVLLEVTKLAKCLHIQHGKKIKSVEIWTKCSLSIFALSFVVNQLYYYPLFCLYHGLNVIKVYKLRSPTMVGIITCGMIFLLLDVAWFLVSALMII